MTDPISGARLPIIETAETRRRGDPSADPAGDRIDSPLRPEPDQDELILSPAARQTLSDQPEIDRSRVEAIKLALREGRYPLDSARIAQGFLDLERMIGDLGATAPGVEDN